MDIAVGCDHDEDAIAHDFPPRPLLAVRFSPGLTHELADCALSAEHEPDESLIDNQSSAANSLVCSHS